MREHLLGDTGDLATELGKPPCPLVQPPQNDGLPFAPENFDGGFNRT